MGAWKFSKKPSSFLTKADYQRAYHKSRRAARRKAGICTVYTCTLAPLTGRTKCREHLQHRVTINRKSVAKRASQPSTVDILQDFDSVL